MGGKKPSKNTLDAFKKANPSVIIHTIDDWYNMIDEQIAEVEKLENDCCCPLQS